MLDAACRGVGECWAVSGGHRQETHLDLGVL